MKTAISIDSTGREAFLGGTNGNVYAKLAEKGSLLWKVHVESHLAAMNRVKAIGDSLNGFGPIIVDGMAYANAGYKNAITGSALLVFSVNGK